MPPLTSVEAARKPYAEQAREVLSRILEGMGIEASVELLQQGDRVVLDILTVEDVNTLIGRKGKTLEAIQLVVNRILQRTCGDLKPVILDVDGYRQRRRHNLTELALRSAERVRDTGYEVVIGPFNAYERHIVHAAVTEDPQVVTESLGNETDAEKKITFRLRRCPDGADAGD